VTVARDSPPIVRFILRYRIEVLFAGLVAALFADYLFTDRLLYGSDSIPSGLFFRGLLVDFVKEFGELPRWNPYILGGLPFLDATHGDTFFPSSILHFLMPVYRGMGHKLILHIFLAGVFMAFYLRSLGLHSRAVAFGSLVYMLSPVFVSYLFAGQDGKMYVTSLAPLVLGFLERGMRTGDVRMFLGLAVAIGLTILSAQIQMAYHAMWFLGALFLVRLFRGPATKEPPPSRLRTSGLFALALSLGLLIAAVQLVPAVAYVKHPASFSVRSEKTDYEHASSWSLHPEEIGSMVVPEFCNAPKGYWGRNVFKYNSDYVGVLTLLLAVLALARRRDATRWFLFGLGAFAVLYSLGGHTPLHRLFYAVVPQVKLFRAPPLVMFGAAFGFSALAALALHDLENAPPRRKRDRSDARLERGLLYGGLGVSAAIALAGLAAETFTSFWTDLFYPGIDAARRQAQAANLPQFRSGALVVAVILAGGTGLLWGRMRGAIPDRAMFVGLIVLAIVDLWRVDRAFRVVMEPDRFIRPDPVLAPLMEESKREKFRVMPVSRRYAMNDMGYFGIESTSGFHDNELAWYRELRTAPESQGLLALASAGYPILRMLNVKYILHDSPDYPNPLPVPGYAPRFRLTDEFEIVEDHTRIPARLADPDFDPASRVVLEEDPGFPSGGGANAPPGEILGYSYSGNGIDIDVVAERPCLLIHAENWFPYWRAFREGEEVPVLRANGVIRAIVLPSGRSSVHLRFRSVPFEIGKWITLSTFAVIAVSLVVGAGLSRFRSER
jgi:hypothetical protein